MMLCHRFFFSPRSVFWTPPNSLVRCEPPDGRCSAEIRLEALSESKPVQRLR